MCDNSGPPSTGKPAALILLPTEIQEAILSQIKDISTLMAVAASCRSLRSLLVYGPNPIIKRVLERSIPPAVLPEALALRESVTLPTIDRESVQALLHKYFTRLNQYLQVSCSLREAYRLERFHRVVHGFTTNFVHQTLSKNPVIGYTSKFEPYPTYSELCRIQRALYRFELCCNLFTKALKRGSARTVIPRDLQATIFFNRFSAWENEQLACIHDYLLRIIDEPFNDVAAHDIEWGEDEVEYNRGYEAGRIGLFRKGYLSQGLKFIRHLARTEDYEKRRRVLRSSMGSIYYFIDDALLLSYRSRDDTRLSEYCAQRTKKEIRPPAVIDPDKGPAEVWRITHLEMPSREFVMANAHIPLRESGYVMWDYDRLSRWGLLKIPWRPIPGPSREEQNRQWEEMRRSFDRRTEIWRSGGRGWWSEHDESKVVYRKE